MRTMRNHLAFLVLALATAAQAFGAEIHDAAQRGDLQRVRALIAADATLVDVEQPPNRKTPLHFAAQGGHKEVVEFLLDKGAQVGRGNIIGETPLHYAATLENPDVAALLLARGANVNARTENGTTALFMATRFQRLATVRLLVDKGADPRETQPNGMTLLHAVAVLGPVEAVAYFLGKGVAVDAAPTTGETALLLACTATNVDIARALLDAKADPNRRDAAGREPLVVAVRRGHPELVKLLLDAGARIDSATTADKRSVLHVAAAMGSGRIVEMLLAKGADRNARDSAGRTPADLAAIGGQSARIVSALGGSSRTANRAPATAALLTRPLKPGESIVWYLGHMGWAVRTAKHFLIFDVDGRAPTAPDEPSLASGWIVPAEIRDLPTTVFVSHGHNDHYWPAIFEWRTAVKNITYVTGFKPEGMDGYVFMEPRETKTLGGVEITTTRANDAAGVGFFVKVDGVTLFHSGDHSSVLASFKQEIDFLADGGLRPDLLFMPVSASGEAALNEGLFYAMTRLSPSAMFPGHARGREVIFVEFARAAAAAGLRIPVHCPEFGGDHYTVPAAPPRGPAVK